MHGLSLKTDLKDQSPIYIHGVKRSMRQTITDRGGFRPLGISADYTLMACQEIKKIRAQLRWSQNDVARATGYTQQQVSYMENGGSRPYADVLFFMQRRLEMMEDFEARLKRIGTERHPGKVKKVPSPPKSKRMKRRARAKNFKVMGQLEPRWWG